MSESSRKASSPFAPEDLIDSSNEAGSPSITTTSPQTSANGASALLQDYSFTPNADGDPERPSPRWRIDPGHSGFMPLESPNSADARTSIASTGFQPPEALAKFPESHFTQREAFLFRTWTEKISLIVGASLSHRIPLKLVPSPLTILVVRCRR